MTRIARWLGIVLILLAPGALLRGESVKSLPRPIGYINDFAGVLSPATKQDLEVQRKQFNDEVAAAAKKRDEIAAARDQVQQANQQ